MGFPNVDEIGDTYVVRGNKPGAPVLCTAKVAFINSNHIWIDYSYSAQDSAKLSLRAFRLGVKSGTFTKFDAETRAKSCTKMVNSTGYAFAIKDNLGIARWVQPGQTIQAPEGVWFTKQKSRGTGWRKIKAYFN